MKKLKAQLILSWLLLLFFVAGQVIIFAHQHHLKYNALVIVDQHHGFDQHQIVQEKCNFCDQMHHAPINLVQPLHFCHVPAPAVAVFYAAQHHYKGKSLVHADGLSPPASV